MKNKLPNIVLIMADDMGYGDLGCYGSVKIKTPHMDRIAREGIRFTDAHSASAVCTPSRYSLLTGRYCWRGSLKQGVLGGFGAPLLEPGRQTIASMLKEKGYSTAVFGKWHLGLEWKKKDGTLVTTNSHDGWNKDDGWYEDGFDVDYAQELTGGPLDHGFDHWFGISGSLDMPPYCFIEDRKTVGIPDREKHPYEAQQRRGLMTEGWRDDLVDVTVAEKAARYFLEKKRSDSVKPVFVYLAPASPHRPCVPPDFLSGTTEGGKRGDMVALVDWMVGRMIEAVERAGETENTLFVVTSDNGAQSTNFDGKDYGHKPNGDWRGQKGDIYEGGHREPLVVRWPSVVPAGSESSALLCLTDFHATFAEMLGSTSPPDTGEDSISFFDILHDPVTHKGSRNELVHHSYDGMFSIRKDQWKYVDGLGSGGFSEPARYLPYYPSDPASQLFNIADDTRETLNLSKVHADKVNELKELLERCKG